MNQTLKPPNFTLNYFWTTVYLLILHFPFFIENLGGIAIVSLWLLPILVLPSILVIFTTHTFVLSLLRLGFFICLALGLAIITVLSIWENEFTLKKHISIIGATLFAILGSILTAFTAWLWYLNKCPKNILLEKRLAWGLVSFHLFCFTLMQFGIIGTKVPIPKLIDYINASV